MEEQQSSQNSAVNSGLRNVENAINLNELKRYAELFYKRSPIIIAITVICFVLGTVYTLRSKKEYKAVASVVVSSATPQVLKEVQDVVATNAPYMNEIFLQTEYAIAGSYKVAARAAERLGLLYDDKHNGLGSIKDLKEREKARQKLDMAKWVMRSTQIIPQKRSQLIEIEAVNEDPKFAADLVNAVASSYIENNVDKRIDGTRDASSWLAGQHEELKKKLNDSEDALYAFMENNGVLNASLESQMEEVKSRLSQFINKLAEIQGSIIAGRLDAEALKQVEAKPELIDSLPQMQDIPVIAELKKKLSDLDAQYSELGQKYLSEHPKMVALRQETESIKRDLQKEVSATIARLERERLSLINTEAGLNQAVTKEREREARMNKLSLEYNRLKREVDTNSRLYELVAGRLKEVDLSSMMRTNNVSILDLAKVPQFPYKPNWAQNLLLSLLLGILLGVGTAFLLEMLDTTFKTQEDIESYLTLPFLGILPVIEGDGGDKNSPKQSRAKDIVNVREKDLYVLHHPKSMPAECSRAIRTNLLFMSPDKPLKSIVVTSSTPKEGKTTTSVSLATTMAQAGSRVLLIDTDMRKPRLHRTFGIPNDVGISSLIVGDAKLEDAVKHTELPNLFVLPCGPLPPNPSELLHTERFKHLLKEFGEKFDKVILDAPPAGAVTDPVILGTEADGTILVIKTGVTSKEIVKRSIRSLMDARVPICGIILNDIDLTSKKYGYYYGKYYRYGRYYGQYHYGESPESPVTA